MSMSVNKVPLGCLSPHPQPTVLSLLKNRAITPKDTLAQAAAAPIAQPSFSDLMQEGMRHRQNSDPDRALPCYLRANEREPNNFLCLHNIALVYVKKFELSKDASLLSQAESFLRQAISHNKTDLCILFFDFNLLGNLLFVQRQWKESHAAFSRGLYFASVLPQNAGFVNLPQKEKEGLEKYAKEMEERLQVCSEQLQKQQAETHSSQTAPATTPAASPQASFAELMQEGLRLRQMLQHDRALACFLKANEIEPNNFRCLHNIALIYAKKFELNKKDACPLNQAMSFFKAAINYNKTDVSILFLDYYSLGIVFFQNRQWEEAHLTFGKGLSRAKQFPQLKGYANLPAKDKADLEKMANEMREKRKVCTAQLGKPSRPLSIDDSSRGEAPPQALKLAHLLCLQAKGQPFPEEFQKMVQHVFALAAARDPSLLVSQAPAEPREKQREQFFSLGNMHYKKGEWRQGAEAYNQANKIRIDQATSHNIAMCLLNLDITDDAMKCLAAAIDIFEKSPPGTQRPEIYYVDCYHLGNCFFDQRDYTNASLNYNKGLLSIPFQSLPPILHPVTEKMVEKITHCQAFLKHSSISPFKEV